MVQSQHKSLANCSDWKERGRKRRWRERDRDFKKINKLLVKEKDCGTTLFMPTSKPTSLSHEFTKR